MKKGKKLLMLWAVQGTLLVATSSGLSAPLMVEKNLFSPDRKPSASEPAAVTAQGNKPGLSPKAIQLDGVMMFGTTKKALVRVKGQIAGNDKNKGQASYMVVNEGESIGEYRVHKIEAKSISLEKDGQVFGVALFAEGKVAPPPAPVPVYPAVQGPVPGQDAAPEGGESVPGQRPNRVPQPHAVPGQEPQAVQNPPMRPPRPMDGRMINEPEVEESEEEAPPEEIDQSEEMPEEG